METLLINFDKIIKPNNLDLLIEKITPIPQTKFNLHVMIIAPKLNIQFFRGLSTKEEKNDYLNSLSFIQSIHTYTYGVFDTNKKVYEILDSNGLFLPQILTTLLENFHSDILIWISVDLQKENLTEIIKHYIDAGFVAPYICKLGPLSHSLRGYNLGMLKENNTDLSPNSVNDVKYVLEEFLTKERVNCEVILQFDSKTISFLRKLIDKGRTVNNDKTVTQKEIAGGLNVNKIMENLIHILEVNKDTVIIGEEEGVNVVKSLYNFHSHPREAYKKHDVKFAWPSAQDYIGFLLSSFEDDAICHMVITIEGIYIMSINNHWVSRKMQLDKDAGNFILDNYNFCYKPGNTPQWYVEKVNSIDYQGYPIFDVKFLPWDKSSQPFKAKFTKLEDTCFTEEDKLIHYRKSHPVEKHKLN